MTIRKILIANRGEIALRIIRTCREMGIKTVAIYSTADKESLHVKFADEAICIGPPPSQQSYLKIPSILSAAEITNTQAIHPGYGFLAENVDFANICREHQIKFIGPQPQSIIQMGKKDIARQIAKKANIPVVPGSKSLISSLKEAENIAENIGYPILIKAAAGGGGRGMRVVQRKSNLEQALNTCQNESKKAFGFDGIYIEKYLLNPRHIEVQILADQHGFVTHLGERDCTLQRRHQKILEEAPANILSHALRQKIVEASIKIADITQYEGVGTVEFLVDTEYNFYFIEMNTRIQVEHPVTEEISHCDIVEEQIRIAEGEHFKNRSFSMRGHAIECRINAEDPYYKFRPSAGKITTFHPPCGHGVRIDTHVYSGYEIPSHYDSLIAKLIVSAKSRTAAIKRLERTLDEFIIEGICTTIPFHKQLIQDPNFIENNYHTSYLEKSFILK